MILLPLLLSLLLISYVIICDYTYDSKNNDGEKSYTLSYDEYNAPSDFKKELEERGFIFDAEFYLSRLNKKIWKQC